MYRAGWGTWRARPQERLLVEEGSGELTSNAPHRTERAGQTARAFSLLSPGGRGRVGVGSSAQNNGGKVATGLRGSPPSPVQIPVRPGPCPESVSTRGTEPCKLAVSKARKLLLTWPGSGPTTRHGSGSVASPPLTHVVQTGKLSPERMLHFPAALDPGAKIGICLETIAGIISVGHYYCGQSFETLRMYWL